MGWLGRDLWRALTDAGLRWTLPVLAVAGYVLADLVSGMVHFLADNFAEAAWKKVVELDPNSDVAKTVSNHIDSFKSSAKSSAGGSGSTSPTAVPTATATQG